MAIYFVQSSQIFGQKIELSGDLSHHLRDVLRLSSGETLDVVDEHRRRYHVALDAVSSKALTVQILSVQDPPSSPKLEIVLAQAVLKRPKMDLVIQKATELGVCKLHPLFTERTVVRPPLTREAHQRGRWQKIEQEASGQCGRVDIPTIECPLDYSSWIQRDFSIDLKLILWELEIAQTLSSCLRVDQRIRAVLLVEGAEGGWTSREVGQAKEAGFQVVSLGKRILRAETASISAISILQYELGDMS